MVLERLLQTDQLSDSSKQPIPVYDLIYELLAMDDEEPDEYHLSHTSALEVLRNLVMGMPWYRFYDMVETVAERLIDNDDTFTLGSPKNESCSYSAYRQRVNELFSEYKVDWRMNETGQLESPLPIFLEEK